MRSALEATRSEPLTAEGWRWLGEDVDLRLVDTAKDARIPVSTRVRAVWALGVLGSDTAYRYLSHVTTTEDVEPPVLAAAVEAFAHGFKATRRQEVTHAAAEHLQHMEVSVRCAAARALGRIGGEDAKRALASRQASENDATVSAEISFALKSTVAAR